MGADHVAVERFDLQAAPSELLDQDLGDGGLAGAGESGEPEGETALLHVLLRSRVCNRATQARARDPGRVDPRDQVAMTRPGMSAGTGRPKSERMVGARS